MVPAAPVAPVAPTAPDGPAGPGAPSAPAGPVAPAAPESPFAPVGPAGPAAPRRLIDCRVCVGCRQFDGVPATPTRYTVPLRGTMQMSMRSSCVIDVRAESAC